MKASRVHLNCGNIILFAAGIVVVLGSLRLSAHKDLWTDEVLTLLLTTNISWTKMWQAVCSGIDGMGPLFYAATWLWAKIGGSSEGWIRALPAICLGAGTIVMGFTLKRQYGPAAALLGVTAAVGSNPNVWGYGAEARAYGLLLGLTAILLSFLARPSVTWKWWIKVGLTQLLITATHPFGLLYATSLSFGAALRPAITREWKQALRIITTSVPSLLALGTWVPVLRKVHDYYVPISWIPEPSFYDLFQAIIVDATAFTVVATFAIIVLVKGKPLTRPSDAANDSLLWPATATLLVPIAAWSVSKTSAPVFLPRYFLPLAWMTACWVAWLAHSVWRQTDPGKRRLGVIGLLSAGVWATGWQQMMLAPHSDAGEQDVAIFGEGATVLCEGPNVLLPRVWCHGTKIHYLGLQEWRFSNSPQERAGATQDYKLTANFARFFPEKIKTATLDDARKLLEANKTVYIIDQSNRQISRYLEEFSRSTILFTTRSSPLVPGGVIWVKRLQCAP